jgi:hypothetical protein
VQKAALSRGGARARRQIPPDRRLADIDAELEQFAVDARCAPEGVGSTHPVDQVVDLAFICDRRGTV